MANGSDKDFKVRLVTEADQTGIQQTEAGLEKIKADAASVGISSSVATQLAAAGAKFDPVTKGFKSVTEEATKAGGATKELAAGSLLAGANLTRARQEALVLARELETGGNVTRTLGSLLGALGTPVVIAAVGGLAIFEAFKHANEQVGKMIADASKLGDDLAGAAKKWEDGARAALTGADIQKIAAEAIPELEKVHAEVQKIQQTELGWFSKMMDAIDHSIAMGPLMGGGADAGKAYKQQADAAKDLAAQEEALHVQAASAAIRSGKLFEQAFEKRKAEPLAQAIGEIESKLASLKSKQDAVDTSTAEGIKQWVDYGQQIANAEKQLSALIGLDKERFQFQKDNAAALGEQKDKAAQLAEEIKRVTDELAALGVTAKTAAEAFAAGEKMAGAEGAEVRKLATELAKAQGESKALTADREKSSRLAEAETQAAQLSLDGHKEEASVVTQLARDHERILDAIKSGDTALAAQLQRQRDLAVEAARKKNVEAEPRAAEDRAKEQQAAAEKAEQQRAAAQKASDEGEVKKYGRVLDPQERMSEGIKKREEDIQKSIAEHEQKIQQGLSDQMEAQSRGITPEQLRNERDYLHRPPTPPPSSETAVPPEERTGAGAKAARERDLESGRKNSRAAELERQQQIDNTRAAGDAAQAEREDRARQQIKESTPETSGSSKLDGAAQKLSTAAEKLGQGDPTLKQVLGVLRNLQQLWS